MLLKLWLVSSLAARKAADQINPSEVEIFAQEVWMKPIVLHWTATTADLWHWGDDVAPSTRSQYADNASPGYAIRIADAAGAVFDGARTVELPARHASIDPTDETRSPRPFGPDSGFSHPKVLPTVVRDRRHSLSNDHGHFVT